VGKAARAVLLLLLRAVCEATNITRQLQYHLMHQVGHHPIHINIPEDIHHHHHRILLRRGVHLILLSLPQTLMLLDLLLVFNDHRRCHRVRLIQPLSGESRVMIATLLACLVVKAG
jgi:hypothetical protein